MSDTTTTDQSADKPADHAAETPEMGAEPDWKSEAEKWKQAARKAQDHAKANAAAAKELEQVRQQSMSETEKAVAQAKAEGRSEGLALGAARIVAAEIRAAAAGRLTAEQLEAYLETTNLAVFIGEDGDVDQAKVARLMDRMAPMPIEEDTRHGFPDLGQGARRGASVPLNGDQLERDIKAKLGIR